MKMMLAAMFLTFTCTHAIAATSAVYCKVDGTIYNAQSEEGFGQCYIPLTGNGDACFTGSRSEIIQLINSNAFHWDEQWLERANYKGTNEVFYISADGPNEERFPMSMKRCTTDFFGRK